MTAPASLPRPLALALLSAAALLAAFFASVERLVYSTGVPTGVASTAALAFVIAAALTAAWLMRADVSGRTVALFFALSAGGGIGGLVGSILGKAAGEVGLFVGGVLGGLAAAPGIAALRPGLVGWSGAGYGRPPPARPSASSRPPAWR